MLQKEVVERMVATPGDNDFGRPSAMLQYRFHLEWLLDVPPESFDPAPQVDSAVVRLIPAAPGTGRPRRAAWGRQWRRPFPSAARCCAIPSGFGRRGALERLGIDPPGAPRIWRWTITFASPTTSGKRQQPAAGGLRRWRHGAWRTTDNPQRRGAEANTDGRAGEWPSVGGGGTIGRNPPLRCALALMPGLPGSILPAAAGAHAEQGWRGTSRSGRSPGDDADPGPDRAAGGRPGDQAEAGCDAQDFVDTADICFHAVFSVKVVDTAPTLGRPRRQSL